MQIITIISDYGENTYYTAALKAKLLDVLPSAMLVDISHHIPSYDLTQAAFLLQNCITDFKDGTIHIVAVETNLKLYKRVLIGKYKNQWVITVDNGFLTMMDIAWDEIYTWKFLPNGADFLSPETLIFPEIAFQLQLNKPEEFFEKTTPVIIANRLNAVVESNQIRATIIHVDGYDNAITNLNKNEFDAWIGESAYKVIYRRNETLTRIETNYASVGSGYGVAVFNEKGWLEIAINKGNGKTLLGLKLGDQVIIEKDND